MQPISRHRIFDAVPGYRSVEQQSRLRRLPLANHVDPATGRKGRYRRVFMAARSRFAEDCLTTAVSRGVRQVVVLGAGLDTFSLRHPHSSLGVRVFEVDHPATQVWKRERITEAGLAAPASLTFAPVDFERQSLAEGLVAAGFESTWPAFFH